VIRKASNQIGEIVIVSLISTPAVPVSRADGGSVIANVSTFPESVKSVYGWFLSLV